MRSISFISLFGIAGSYAHGVSQTIKTSSGPVRGHTATHESGVSAFLGIPYALPPTGNRRFMPPEKYHGDDLIGADSIVRLSSIQTGFELLLSFHDRDLLAQQAHRSALVSMISRVSTNLLPT